MDEQSGYWRQPSDSPAVIADILADSDVRNTSQAACPIAKQPH